LRAGPPNFTPCEPLAIHPQKRAGNGPLLFIWAHCIPGLDFGFEHSDLGVFEEQFVVLARGDERGEMGWE